MSKLVRSTTRQVRTVQVLTVKISNQKITVEDKTREDKTREDKTREDKTREDKTREDKTREDRTREDKTREDKTREDKTREDKTREDKTREDMTREHRTREDKTREDKRTGVKKSRYDRPVQIGTVFSKSLLKIILKGRTIREIDRYLRYECCILCVLRQHARESQPQYRTPPASQQRDHRYQNQSQLTRRKPLYRVANPTMRGSGLH